MADITVRLIWYKLGEVSEKMAEAGRSWYTELDFDSYVLDLLLLGWFSICVVVIIAVNALVAAFGPLQRQPQDRYREYKEGVSLCGAVLPLETAQWFNSAINWFYLHYYHAPDYLDEWLKSLNEQMTKLGGPVQSRFDRIQSGSLPPKVTHVSCEASPQDRFIIHAKMESRDLSFVVFASQQTHEGVKLTNVTASVLRLKGTLRVQSYREGADVKMCFNFEGKPEIRVQVKPLNPYQEANELVDLGVVEENVRNSIILAKTTFNVTHLLMPGDLHTQAKGPPGQEPPNSGPGANGNLPQDPKGFQKMMGGGLSGASSTKHQQLPKHMQQQQQQQQLQQQQLQQQEQRQKPSQEKEDDATPLIIPVDRSLPSPIHPQMAPTAKAEVPQNTPVAPLDNRHVQAMQAEQMKQQQQQLQLQLLQQQQQHQQQQQQHIQQQQMQQQQQQPQLQQVQRRDQQRIRPQSRPEGVFEPVEAMNLQSSVYSAPPKPPRMVGDKRLLVKVIKANGLTVREIGTANTVCMLSTDDPVQGYATSVVKNTQNPFWDEHFLFDITQDTQEVHVEIYDTGKPQGDEFIGEAIVYVEDLRKTPSSRQILRLHPQPGNMEYNCGTVTAEFLFMDPSEADLLLESMTTASNNQLSPRRRIEVERSVTPSGTVVTKTTTTTQRPQYGRHDPGLDGSPNYIEKSMYDEDSSRFSPYNNSSSNVSSGLRQQQIPTIESSPMDEAMEPYPADHGGHQPQPIALKDKKKGGFGSGLFKRFGRKKRAQSADRTTSSMREGSYLRPPEPNYGPQSKDDLELVRPQGKDGASPNLKKSRTLGGSLKKLFRRGRKRSQTRGDSRESSMSRGSRSKGPSRDSSLTRHNQRDSEYRASSVS